MVIEGDLTEPIYPLRKLRQKLKALPPNPSQDTLTRLLFRFARSQWRESVEVPYGTHMENVQWRLQAAIMRNDLTLAQAEDDLSAKHDEFVSVVEKQLEDLEVLGFIAPSWLAACWQLWLEWGECLPQYLNDQLHVLRDWNAQMIE
jgi:hypothetical protein